LLKNKKLFFISISIITLIIILYFLFVEKKVNISQQIPTKLITSVHKDLPLKFESDQTNIILQPGEVQTINYSVENLGSKSVSAMATFQVYPPELKDFMTKMNCFCYEKQTLKAGAKEKYALVLLVDPNVTKNIKEAIIQFVYFKK
jgi:cytochrome c oxidase assembly protein subunit 11